jgi:hypothetical protein
MGVLVPVALAVGIAGGVGVAYWEYGTTVSDPAAVAVATPETGGPGPLAVPEDTVHKFGSIEMGGSMEHSFTVQNKGEKPLTLTMGETTCKCTGSEVQDPTVPPGGSGTVLVKWKGEGVIGEFRHSATILTNDPKNPKITFTVEGELTEAVSIDPGELVMTSLSPRDPVSGQVRIYSLHADNLEITGHKFENETGSQQFDVAFEPLAEEALADRKAKSGVLATLTSKPPLPLGPIQHRISFESNLASKPKLEVSIQGMVVSDISIIGPDWSQSLSVLRLGLIESKQGAKRTLRIMTRGPHRKEIKFDVAKKVPEFLQVSFGELAEVNQGKATQVPITIEIPKGSPPVNHLGSQLGEMGEILLQTNHPDAKEVRLRVQFAIED